jgi:hypothetical protein
MARHGIRSWGWLAGALAMCLAANCAYAAAQRSIRTVDPASVMQGDTVALTITGENLPTGGVVVEFFPQQIAVIKILSASATEVVAQIKVPSMAPPGLYNMVVYNQLGDEVFGQGLLNVGSGLLTPIFNDYDPKVIAEASSGFALMLTGDSITPTVIDHLSMQWFLGQQRLTNLKTSFGMGGTGTIVCAVNGKPPSGTLRGRVFMDEKPVYLVDVKVQGLSPAIIGHSPVQLPVDQTAYTLRILGANLDDSVLPTLAVSLESATLTAKATAVKLLDAASLEATIAGPLPAGEYTLVVKQGDATAYTGQLTLATAAIASTTPPPAAPNPPPENSTPAATASTSGNPAAVPTLAAKITGASPTTILAGDVPFRITLQGEGLTPEIVDRLTTSLISGNTAANLMFAGAQHNGITCVFGPPEGGWVAGQGALLTITDTLGVMPSFSAQITISPGAKPPPATTNTVIPPPAEAPVTSALETSASTQGVMQSGSSEIAAASGTWRAKAADVNTTQGVSHLSVTLEAPQPNWDPALLKGSFTLLPTDSQAASAFSNLSLQGGLSFRRTEAGEPVGEFTGNFVAGELLLNTAYGDGVPEVSVIGLDCPLPKASLIPPAAEKLARDTATNKLLPETLRFVVDFAPLVVKDPAFLMPVCTPIVDIKDAYQFSASGTQVEIIVQTKAWRSVREWGAGFGFELNSKVKLDWAAEPKLTLAVDNSVAQSQASVALAQLPALIDDKGFVITILPGPGSLPVADWSKVTASSDSLLLGRNIAQFQVIATAGKVLEQQCVRLRFRRDAETLSDMAYSLLQDDLLAAKEVSVKLEWPELGCSAEGKLTFKVAPQGTLNDLLNDLSKQAP